MTLRLHAKDFPIPCKSDTDRDSCLPMPLDIYPSHIYKSMVIWIHLGPVCVYCNSDQQKCHIGIAKRYNMTCVICFSFLILSYAVDYNTMLIHPGGQQPCVISQCYVFLAAATWLTRLIFYFNLTIRNSRPARLACETLFVAFTVHTFIVHINSF